MGTRTEWPRYLHTRDQLRSDPGRMCLVRYASEHTSPWRVAVALLVKEHLVGSDRGFWSRIGGVHRVEAVPLGESTCANIAGYWL